MSFDRPQRIVRPAAPGELLKRFLAEERPRKAEAEHNPGYLALVRQCPCLSCGLDPCAEAAHVRFSAGSLGKANAMGRKPEDRFALPLCADDHRLAKNAQHHVGNERLYWARLGIDPLLTAERLFAQRGDLVAMRAVVMIAIAERNASLPVMPPNTGGGNCPQS